MAAAPDGTATPYRSWVAACAAAESVGMAAAAGASRLAEPLAPLAGLAVVVAGGLVEGVALGSAQAVVLARLLPALRRRRYVAATVLVAGLGWAAASAPAVLADGGAGDGGPPVLLSVAGGLGLGLVLGAVLGAAQSAAIGPAARHPWRWTAANAAAWPGAMALVLLGAGTPGTGWPLWSVAGVGAVTGAVAGTALGLVSGRFLGRLGAPAPVPPKVTPAR